MVTVAELYVYPVKSCKGVALTRATFTTTGFAHDREWMIVRPDGQFVTQREEPRLALITVSVTPEALQLSAPAVGSLVIPLHLRGTATVVTCWRDTCRAFDAGDNASHWLQSHMGRQFRLVRFDPSYKRTSSLQWTKGVEALNQFADGYPLLITSQTSLDDLNRRLKKPLPMKRFRPNIVIDGVPPYGEDDLHELHADGVIVRLVKPCARCVVTTVEQSKGLKDGPEPLKTLSTYRYDPAVRGVVFGQNAIIVSGVGASLCVGQRLRAVKRSL